MFTFFGCCNKDTTRTQGRARIRPASSSPPADMTPPITALPQGREQASSSGLSPIEIPPLLALPLGALEEQAGGETSRAPENRAQRYHVQVGRTSISFTKPKKAEQAPSETQIKAANVHDSHSPASSSDVEFSAGSGSLPPPEHPEHSPDRASNSAITTLPSLVDAGIEIGTLTALSERIHEVLISYDEEKQKAREVLLRRSISEIPPELYAATYFEMINSETRIAKIDDYTCMKEENYISFQTQKIAMSMLAPTQVRGWKIHISLERDPPDYYNYMRAWNILLPILVEFRINRTKIIRSDKHIEDNDHLSGYGRHITIYAQLQEADSINWHEFFERIDEVFSKNNIRPGERSPICRRVSDYCAVRNDATPTGEYLEPKTLYQEYYYNETMKNVGLESDAVGKLLDSRDGGEAMQYVRNQLIDKISVVTSNPYQLADIFTKGLQATRDASSPPTKNTGTSLPSSPLNLSLVR